MKGIGIKQYGDESQITTIELSTPSIGANEVLITVKASAVNPVDWKVRDGLLKDFIPYQLPLILGWDAAGIISAVGDEVKQFQVGDDVFFRPEIEKQGTYADEIVVPAKFVAAMPTNLSYVEAASLPLVGLTAWQALVEEGNIKAGDKVLILAGSGGVGSFAIQLAKACGAYVATTTSSKNISFVKALGADQVFAYDQPDYLNSDLQFDFMFDTLGGEPYAEALMLMKEQAIIATIISDRDVAPASSKAALEKAKQLNIHYVFTRPDGQSMSHIKELVEQGKIKPIVSTILPLTVEGVVNAHRLSETGRTIGKIILERIES